MKAIKLILALAILAALGYGAWWAYNKKVTEQPIEQQGEVIELTDDTTESINEALDGINIDDKDVEFEDIDDLIDEL